MTSGVGPTECRAGVYCIRRMYPADVPGGVGGRQTRFRSQLALDIRRWMERTFLW